MNIVPGFVHYLLLLVVSHLVAGTMWMVSSSFPITSSVLNVIRVSFRQLNFLAPCIIPLISRLHVFSEVIW